MAEPKNSQITNFTILYGLLCIKNNSTYIVLVGLFAVLAFPLVLHATILIKDRENATKQEKLVQYINGLSFLRDHAANIPLHGFWRPIVTVVTKKTLLIVKMM